MGILDEAIREHLELKRSHGADDSELKQLEDQAFGPPERPGAAEAAPSDPAAEAPTEFMSQPDLGEDRPGDLEDAAPERESAPSPRREPAAGMADIQEPPARVEEEAAEEEPAAEQDEDEPISEEQPAAEHETIPAPEEGSPGSHTTAERHAIADQPTEMFDVEEELAATEVPAPPDEDLVAEEINEARLGPVEPLTPLPGPAPVDEDEDDDDDFFSEQRLSDELDQALEAPVEPEPEPVSDEHEAVVGEPTDEHEVQQPEKRGGDEDVLEETPDFLEESPEDDELWFEQKPPKDFDFDD